MIYPVLKVSAKHAYNAGWISVPDGANPTNCHIKFFSSPDLSRAWQKGRIDAEKSRENSHQAVHDAVLHGKNRDDVAAAFARVLLPRARSVADFEKIRDLILTRYTMSGFVYIKTKAWKIAETLHEEGHV